LLLQRWITAKTFFKNLMASRPGNRLQPQKNEKKKKKKKMKEKKEFLIYAKL